MPGAPPSAFTSSPESSANAAISAERAAWPALMRAFSSKDVPFSMISGNPLIVSGETMQTRPESAEASSMA